MKILVSIKGSLFGPGLVDLLSGHPGVSQVDIADDFDGVLNALSSQRYDLHVVGIACLDIAFAIGRHHKRNGSALFDPAERVLVAVDPDPLAVMEVRRLGFARVMGPSLDLVERLTCPVGSGVWRGDHVDNFPVGDSAATTLADICHDEVDRRIITLIVDGYSDAEIAEQMNYAVQSVRNRVSRMLQAGGFRNRTDLAVKMVKRR